MKLFNFLFTRRASRRRFEELTKEIVETKKQLEGLENKLEGYIDQIKKLPTLSSQIPDTFEDLTKNIKETKSEVNRTYQVLNQVKLFPTQNEQFQYQVERAGKNLENVNDLLDMKMQASDNYLINLHAYADQVQVPLEGLEPLVGQIPVLYEKLGNLIEKLNSIKDD